MKNHVLRAFKVVWMRWLIGSVQAKYRKWVDGIEVHARKSKDGSRGIRTPVRSPDKLLRYEGFNVFSALAGDADTLTPTQGRAKLLTLTVPISCEWNKKYTTIDGKNAILLRRAGLRSRNAVVDPVMI